MPKSKPLPPLAELQAAFEYDPETGIFTHTHWKGGRASAGSVAGAIRADGYVEIKHKMVVYKAHRLAWLMGHGVDPCELCVDHRDRNPTNNSLSNLRLCTHKQNRSNTAGKGWAERNGRYRAYVGGENKLIHLGTYDTPEEAHAIYAAKAVELRGEWAADVLGLQQFKTPNHDRPLPHP